MKIKRRDFLKISCSTCGYLFASNLTVFAEDITEAKEAIYYEHTSGLNVQCRHCPHQCVIANKKRGFCRIKENQNGKLYNLVYGQPCAVHVDPIEKKPLFHVMPGSKSFSIATVGCNLRCKFCQNWQISQATPEQIKSVHMPPDEVLRRAKQTGSLSIAYTYTEPTIFYEYTLDIAKIACAQGVKNVMHSNGFLNPAPLRNLCKYMTAINVDLKGFDQNYYQDICAGNLKNVLDSLVIIKREMGVWLELTNLIIPTLNDTPDEIRKMCQWIKTNLGDEVPIHFSRFHPTYKLATLPPTPVSTLETAKDIAGEAGLKYVYLGNLPGHSAENSYCPNCHKVVIRRSGYTILENDVLNGKCKYCNYKIAGVWT